MGVENQTFTNCLLTDNGKYESLNIRYIYS